MKTYKQIRIECTVNGNKVSLEVDAGETALEMIRNRLSLKGTKEGCGIGECGACTIVVDGKSINACLMLAAQLHGREIITVEGLEENSGLHPLQQSFMDHHAVQCGFCTPGLLMSSYALLKENPHPDRMEIIDALSGNVCRCTGYQQIVESVEDATERLGKEKVK
ncbi:MAG TPA: (2Fe-2S)-binding protein [Desulfobacteraceae bacterium]|nr:(2Fe-2S)-binding protein [Desulfobacteraceae bacterium]HPJ68016.1 (2Fe-2S)-binding protein [Desulfobacteraceae bacterium]